MIDRKIRCGIDSQISKTTSLWQKAIGGRLESRLRFGSEITWNTFPLPHFDDDRETRLIEAGKDILQVRSRHLQRSLADHYDFLPVDKELLDAHTELDKLMDEVLGLSTPTGEERQNGCWNSARG